MSEYATGDATLVNVQGGYEQEFPDSPHMVFAAVVQVVSAAGTIVAIEDFGSALRFFPLKAMETPRCLSAKVWSRGTWASLWIGATQGGSSRWELHSDVIRAQNVCDAVSAHLQQQRTMTPDREFPGDRTRRVLL